MAIAAVITTWLRYLAAATLATYVVAQLYLLLAYAGRAPIAGSYMSPNPVLAATARKSLWGAALAIPVMLWARWPALVTYLLALGALGRLLDLYRCARTLPPFTYIANRGAFHEHRKRQIWLKIFGVAVGLFLTALSALFLGH